MAISNAERYTEWLERLDIPVEDMVTIEGFTKYLADELGITEEPRVSALTGARDIDLRLSELDVKAISITYPWGEETRFGIKGYPGLWGWTRMKEITGFEE